MMLLFVIPIASPAESSSIIMIITEVGHIVESVWINIFAPLVIVVSKIVHILLVEQSVSNPKEERIVKASVQRTQVTSNVPHVAIEDLTNSVNSWGLRELTPEPFGYFWDSIDSETINMILADKISNPIQKCGPHIVIFLFEICQLGKSAVLDPVLIVVGEILIWNLAPVVIVRGIIERSVDSEVGVEIPHVIADHVNHD